MRVDSFGQLQADLSSQNVIGDYSYVHFAAKARGPELSSPQTGPVQCLIRRPSNLAGIYSGRAILSNNIV